MKSRISLFDPVVFRKNVTRFAPAWALYTIGLFMIIFLVLDSTSTTHGFARDLGYMIAPMALLNFCYAFLCAQLLHGDLYNSRMCNALHAMPLRRETWFATNAISGLAFSAVPNFAVMLFCMLFTGKLWIAPILWFVAVMLQFLFFFGTGILSSYCVGNRFAMLLVYAILNGFSVIAYWLVETLYAPLLYGIQVKMDVFVLLCPLLKMMDGFNYFEVYSHAGSVLRSEAYLELSDGWIYIGICAALGLLYAGGALLLYRKRNLECAGDFVAVKWLSPVFLILYTFCGGAVCHGFFSLFLGEESMAFLIVGLAIGFFTGKMLLERTVRVFRGKTVLRFGILLVVFLATILLTEWDPVGITRWVPKAEQVKSLYFYTGSGRYSGCTVTQEDEIRQLLTVHQHGVENRNDGVNGKQDVKLYLTYTMKNGIAHDRNYYIDVDTEAGQILKRIISSPEVVFNTQDLSKFLDTVFVMELPDGMQIPKDQWQGLYNAMLQDCAAGNMAQDWNYYRDQNAAWLTITLDSAYTGGYYKNMDIRIYEGCENTMDWLEDHGYNLEKFG